MRLKTVLQYLVIFQVCKIQVWNLVFLHKRKLAEKKKCLHFVLCHYLINQTNEALVACQNQLGGCIKGALL